jgi:hypothetical protein
MPAGAAGELIDAQAATTVSVEKLAAGPPAVEAEHG